MRIFLLLLLISVFSSCMPFEEPVFKTLENTSITTMSSNQISGSTELIFFNPNHIALDLAATDIIVFIDSIPVATINQDLDATMKANSDFSLPVNITLDFEALAKNDPLFAVNKGFKILAEQKVDVQFGRTISEGTKGHKKK